MIMKKLLITSLIFVITTASLSAQTKFSFKSGYYNLIKFSEVKYNGKKFKDFDSRGFMLEFLLR